MVSIAVVTASASVVVAVLVFVLNQWGVVVNERRKAKLDRVTAQLRDLYGPLKALADANEAVWGALRAANLPDVDERRGAVSPTPDVEAQWAVWATNAFLPVNREMRNLIVHKADLLIEPELPEPLRTFCAHVTALEVAISSTEEAGHVARALIHHPGRRLIEYLDASNARLRQEQAALLRSSG